MLLIIIISIFAQGRHEVNDVLVYKSSSSCSAHGKKMVP